MSFAKLMSLPVVAFLMITLTAILVLAEMNSHNPLNIFHPFNSTTTTVVQSTVIVPAHPTPAPVVVPGSGETLTPSGSMPTLTECPQNSNKPIHGFQICGSNFDPNTRIQLVFQYGGGSSKSRHIVHVGPSGNFQDFLPISSCKDVPTIIIAQDVAHPSVNLGELQNILFGKCSPNPQQKAGHH